MVDTKEKLSEYILLDNSAYLEKSKKERIIGMIALYPDYQIMKYKRLLRKAEYYFNTCNNHRIRFLMALLYERRKNKLGEKLGIEIDINCFGPGLQIFHGAGIVVNPNARIGANCKLHGANCIGNDGHGDETPQIGNDVDIGFGACIIGNVHIADKAVIGANAVVKRSFDQVGEVIVGVPANSVKGIH